MDFHLYATYVSAKVDVRRSKDITRGMDLNKTNEKSHLGSEKTWQTQFQCSDNPSRH